MSSEDINVIALVKGSERYVFLFDDNNRSKVLRTLGRYASQPDLSFSWYDAAVLSQKVRRADASSTAEINRLFATNTTKNSNENDSEL